MEFVDLVTEAASILRSQPILRRVHGSAIVIGDLHGDIEALERALKLREEKGAKYLILLGDYVDRGDHQVEVVSRIAELVLSDPNFIALRGNHEDRLVCRRYGFTTVLERDKIPKEPVMEFFANLPLVAVSNEIYMAHGGIPIDPEFRVEQVLNNPDDYPREDHLSAPNQIQICWNDPITDEKNENKEQMPSGRGSKVYEWGIPTADRFFELNNLSLIIRAHIAIPSGSKWFLKDRVLSLFSANSGAYRGFMRKAAYLDLDDPSTVEVISLDEE